MKTLIILGAGQYGFVAKETAEAMGDYSNIAFLDDDNPIAIGKLIECTTLEYDEAFVAIGNPDVRCKYVSLIEESQHSLATLIHPRSIVAPSATVNVGSIVEAGAVVCTNSKIGKACIVMANAVIGHEASIGSFCQIKYNSSIHERGIVPDKSIVPCNSVWEKEK